MVGMGKNTIIADADGVRVDSYLAAVNKELSRSYIQKLIDDGQVLVNNRIVKSNYKLRINETITMNIPEPVELKLNAENISLDILYEDDDVIVVNKPQGMVVHPAVGNHSGTLVNALLGHCNDLSGINGVMRPGIVHRIDKDTSGVLLIAKNDSAHRNLAEQIKEHSVNRRYIALVEGIVKPDKGTIEGAIGRHPVDRKKMDIVPGGKFAVTHFSVLKRFKKHTLVEAKLETGRTHQIRVHMAHIGHPVVGDAVYGIKKQEYDLKGQALHAAVLGFVHPRTGQYIEFKAPLPLYFEELIKKLSIDD
jgi:23S rRNA pseudouridine1911/1915/1917 synthase